MLIALVPALKDIALAKIKTRVELAKFRRQTMTAGLKILTDSLPVQCVVLGLHPVQLYGVFTVLFGTVLYIKTPKHGPKVFGMQVFRMFHSFNQSNQTL